MDDVFCSCWPCRKRRSPPSGGKPGNGRDLLPSTTEYLFEGAKMSLALLKGVADLIPVPYVALAFEAASRLFEAGDQIRSSQQELRGLNGRVSALLLVMATPLVATGQKPRKIPPDLKSDFEQLKTDLDGITESLREIIHQNYCWSLLLKNRNTETIRASYSQLQGAIEKFEVSRRISETIRQCEIVAIAREGLDVAKEGLGVAKESLRVASTGLDIATKNHDLAVEGIGVANQSLAVATSGLGVATDGLGVAKEGLVILKNLQGRGFRPHEGATLLSRVMPSKPDNFHGRDLVIANIVPLLTAEGSPRIAILGPGGMGKTSVALAIMEHPDVQARFNDRRFWVPCVEATSPSLFLDILAGSLRVTPATDDLLFDITTELRASSDPRVILLDNFETPWDLKGYGSRIEDVLCALARVPHVALLLTMRSNQPPSHDIKWDKSEILPHLEPLAARQAYINIHPEADSDAHLESLLKDLGMMPLAITLMATVGRNTGILPTKLLEKWNDPTVGTSLLDDGSESKKTNINFSIHLSIQSPHMQDNPNAITVLSILSMLPGGASYDFLEKLTTIPVIPALNALTKAALVEKRAFNSIHKYHVQPVTGAYALHYHPLASTDRSAVYEAFCDFVEGHKSEPDDSTFTLDVQALAGEATNIQTVLMEAVRDPKSADKALKASLTFCWYQFWTIPRIEMVERTIETAKGTKNEWCTAEGLRCKGSILLISDRYSEACGALNEARELFIRLNEPALSAYCLLKHGEVRWAQVIPNAALENVQLAQQEFEALEYALGIAESKLMLGRIYWQFCDYPRSRSTLLATQQEFLNLKRPVGAAHCLFYLARCDKGQRLFEEAKTKAYDARREFQRLGCVLDAASCLIHVGWCQIEQSLWTDGAESFKQGLDEYLQLGRPLGIAQCWEGLGNVFMPQSQYDSAVIAFQEAQKHYERINTQQGRRGAKECSSKYAQCLRQSESAAGGGSTNPTSPS